MDNRTTAEAHASRNYTNGKPYRTRQQRAMASATAVKRDGTFHSNAPVSYHPPVD